MKTTEHSRTLAGAAGSAKGFWRSPAGENHGRDSRPGDVWHEPGDLTDTDRLNWLLENGNVRIADEYDVKNREWSYEQLEDRAAIDREILSSPNIPVSHGSAANNSKP